MFVSVYQDDEEAYALWRDAVGVPEARICRLGAADNFWESGATGPPPPPICCLAQPHGRKPGAAPGWSLLRRQQRLGRLGIVTASMRGAPYRIP